MPMARKEINNYSLYLPVEREQCVDCDRWKHLLYQVPALHNEVRFFISGVDIDESELEYPLPYATFNGKKKSFSNMWKLIMPFNQDQPYGTN